MRLYYRPGTGRPFRPAWALEEIGIPYEAVAVTSEEAAGEEYRARQPLGRVPTLEDDQGNCLFESAGLVIHIGDQHPDSGLMRALGDPDRGRIYQWSFAAMTELEPPLVQFLLNAQSNPELAAAGATKFADSAQAFEQALKGREYLVGDSLTAADIVLAGVLLIARLGQQLEGLPILTAYLDRLRPRPAFQKALVVTESLLRDAGAV
ncbi:MAG TPA: glutathione S-transferase family protein [Solirubrobacteraceae bacterium]|jgi:glutathione S-transferase|nr:glutathione S-transferase family protein [Solirubrobacteraceae bacterium]